MAIYSEVIDEVLTSRPDLQPLINNFATCFDVTWGRDRRLHGTEIVAFFLRPKRNIAEMFGFERELLLIFHPYTTLQPRILHIASQIYPKPRPKAESNLSFSFL